MDALKQGNERRNSTCNVHAVHCTLFIIHRTLYTELSRDVRDRLGCAGAQRALRREVALLEALCMHGMSHSDAYTEVRQSVPHDLSDSRSLNRKRTRKQVTVL